jgi:hypothetical protein
MEIDFNTKAKANDLLQEILLISPKEQQIRFILSLGEMEYVENDLDASKYSKRSEYRKALIQNRKDQITRHFGSIFSKLEQIGLKIISDSLVGENVLTVIVVDGSVEQCIKALELPQIKSAFSNREVNLIAPM